MDVKKLGKGSHIHLMGICGTAMASLAGLLQESGFRITGSDENVYPPMSTQLKELGIEIMPGYKKQNLDPPPDLVVVGNVITRQHEEAKALLESDIPYTSLPKALGEFVIDEKDSLVVSGTHGKTTTTSMLAWVADVCGMKPGFLIGGIAENFHKSFRQPEAKTFVIEGDEYDTAFFDKVPKFIYYRPTAVILTSLEFDHADIYASLDEIKKAFIQLMKLVPEKGVVVANADDPNVLEVVQHTRAQVVTYGLNTGDYQAVDRRVEVGRNQFSVAHKGRRTADVAVKQFGPHNTLNALATFALASELGWPLHLILQGLASFKGVKRRQEVIGEPQGITVIEDFAHHPTAVSLTIQTMGERFPGRRLFAVFEPRSATSRRRIFQKDYMEALTGAHCVVVATPHDQSRIAEEDRLSSSAIVDELNNKGTNAHCLDSVERIIDFLAHETQSGDVILIMSNGAFGGIYGELLAALENKKS